MFLDAYKISHPYKKTIMEDNGNLHCPKLQPMAAKLRF